MNLFVSINRIVKLRHIFSSQVYLTLTHLVVVMAYASGGELFQYVQNSGYLSEDFFFFFRQLMTAVEAMHNSGLVSARNAVVFKVFTTDTSAVVGYSI